MSSIENLIIASLQEYQRLSWIKELNAETKSKLVFPMKRDGKKRISEQEARFLFVKQLEKDDTFHYSVEVPTKEKYKFLGANDRSGNFDICLYENGKRKHLIEFKALNPKQSSYSKDFEKLLFDESDLGNYFIQVLESIDGGTIPNIEGKYIEAIKSLKAKNRLIRSRLKIYLCAINVEDIMQYEVNKDGRLIKIK